MLRFRTLLILILCWMFGSSSGQTVKILTYNIRYENNGDGANSWSNRRAWLCDQIRQAGPDLFGIQEGLAGQVGFIDKTLTAYRHIGVGREDGKEKGEFSAIYYDKQKYRVVKEQTFWLSPTPEKVSVGWDAALERICTCGLFEEKASGNRFWMFNTHFDHMGTEARKNSATLILQKIKQLNTGSYPVILTGDFNAGPESDPVKILRGQFIDSQTADKSMSMMPGGTFNNFDPEKPSVERIDFIFCSTGNTSPLFYQVMQEQREGKFASDHFPVYAKIRLTEK